MSNASDSQPKLSEAGPGMKDETRVFYCKFCTRKFSNLQALGGHQNAHKRERSVAKREKVAAAIAAAATMNATNAFDSFGGFYHPYYSAMAAHSLRNKALVGFAIRPQSAIQKLSRPRLDLGAAAHNYRWWSREQYMAAAAAAATQQLQSGRFLQSVNSNGGSVNLAGSGLESIAMARRNRSSSSSQNFAADQYNIHGLDLSLKL